MEIDSPSASFIGTIPANYDRYLGPLIFEFSAADMAKRVASGLNGAARVLEVACGTGISTRHLSEKTPGGTEITATDLNQAMLDFAVEKNGALEGVTYQQADALALPFADNEFDAVVCQFGVMFFPDKAAGLAEMSRVLKPGGQLTITIWDRFEVNPAVGIVDSIIKSAFDTNPPRFLEVPFNLLDVSAVESLYHGAGFQDVDVTHVSEAVKVLDHENVARGFLTGNPTVLEVNDRGSVDIETLIKAASKKLEDTFGPVPVALPFREITFQSRKSKP